MTEYIHRKIEREVESALEKFPVVAITGPRQCGKSTLVKHILQGRDDVVMLDLERDADLRKLTDPEMFFSNNSDKLICIDEVQRKPDLFKIIRYWVDKSERNGVFLLLGSASRDLLRQSSESLAGRIIYKHLTPFLLNEIEGRASLLECCLKGTFPRSILIEDEYSMEWRENFITTFLERDLLQWRNFTPAMMRRLWMMLAGNNGQTVNYTALGNSLDLSNVSISNYIDLLESTYMVHVVRPYFSNMGKRMTKSPKVYVADSGLTTALLGISTGNQLLGNSVFGAIWEQMVLSNIKGNFPQADVCYYRTSNGVEMDFVVTLRGKIYAVECKTSTAPSLQKGTYNAIEDINPNNVYVVAPIDSSYSINENIQIVTIPDLIENIKQSMQI
ncbi:MAG: ATP-binding protein [Paludibacteraceae bacterium]|nr:ATP-binding protein [Paludibacteraceae bacterium]